MKKLTILTISALAIMAAASAAFSAEAKTEPTSQDVQMKNGSWTELAQLYPVAFVEQNVSEELTPEKLASWWDVFGDPTMTDLITRALEKNRDLASAIPARHKRGEPPSVARRQRLVEQCPHIA